ncbi:right-handed parallel beta-helix repeat-containing protein [Candidatus Gracilibacteria bacterium]|nr:right-handed parallel beta-helix repeat-containing protein [Candidatus Gracilibacteria bacterium]
MKNKKLVKKIHKHVKQHHKKYFLGAGIGFLIFKIITLVIGGVGLLGDNFSKAEWIGPDWNNDVFVDQTFWDNTPSEEQIKQALLGLNSGDKTFYTDSWTENVCDYGALNIVPLNPGTDTIPSSLATNTIYVLESGNYITTRKININQNNCVSVIGKGEVNFYSSIALTLGTDCIFNINRTKNLIFDNIKIDGIGDGLGGTHARNRHGIYAVGNTIGEDNSTFNNIEIFNNTNGIDFELSSHIFIENSTFYDNNTYAGLLFLGNGDGNKIRNSTFYNNVQGIRLQSNTDHIIENISSYNNSSNGIYLDNSFGGKIDNSQIYNNTGAGIYLQGGSGHTIDNCDIYNNINGTYINGSNNNIIKDSKLYSNRDFASFLISGANNNTIINSKLYSNDAGIGIASSSNNNIKNSQFYNNNDGIFLIGSSNTNINNSQSYNNVRGGINGRYNYNNSINNSQFYNNFHGIRLLSGGNNNFNNSQFYNNDIGIEINNGLNNNIHNSQFYNNNTGIVLVNIIDTSNKYYGNIKIFGNGENAVPNSLYQGTNTYYGSLGRITGTVDNGGSMDCSWISNPITTGLTYLQTTNLCNTKQKILNWSGNITNNYRYGTNIFTQVRPVKRSGANIVLYGTSLIDYDTGKYIGQHQDFGGTFNINNNNGITNQTGVVLYNNLIGVNQMNFSTDGSNRNGREIYNTTKNWNLSSSTGLKNIFADFSGDNGEIFMGLDTIIYDTNFDYEPDQFTFVDKTGVELNTIYTSNIVTISGMGNGLRTGIFIDSGTLFKNGSDIGTGGTGGNGDQFYIELSSSSGYFISVSSDMYIGGISDNFRIVTKEADYEPNQVRINDIFDAELNTIYTSNTVSIIGMSPGVFTGINIDTGTLFKNLINIGTGGTGGNGDQFYIQLISSNLYSTTVTSNLLMGSMHQSFDVMTKAIDYIPNQFTFLDKTGAELNTIYTSNIVTISGMGTGLRTGVSIDTGTLFKNLINIGTGGTGGNSDQFYIELTSSSGYLSSISSTMTIAGRYDQFDITTKDDNGFPVISGANNGAYYSGEVDIQIIDDNFDGIFVNSNRSTQSGFTLTGSIGSVTSYYLTAVDLAGNATYISFFIDNAPPITVDNVNTATSSGDQNITLTATDNGTGVANIFYCIDNTGGTCTPNNTGTVTVTCNIGNVCQKIVRYFSVDKLGNIESINTSNTITIDKQAPQNIGFDINGGITYTTGVNIWITNITYTDARAPIQIAYGTSQNVNNRTGWSVFKPFTLENIDGEKIIYVRFKDAGGNISIISGSIILDANAPVITINNPNTNPSTGKTITASTNEGILTMTTGSTNTTCDASRNFITYSITNFSGESDNGKYVCYKAIDSGGNITYNLSNAIAGIDRTNPTISIISPSSIVGETGIFISVNTNENSECRYLPSALLDFDNMVLLEGTGLSHSGNHIGSEGINTLYFRCKDLAGNISTGTLYEFTINLGAPVIQFVIGTTPNNPTNNSGVNIYLTGTEITKYKYKLITGSSCNGVVYDGGEIDINTTITQGPSVSDEEYSYCSIGFKTGLNVWQVTGTKYTFIYDNTPPVITVNDGVNPNWNTGDNINLSVNYNLAGASGTKYIEVSNSTCDGSIGFSSAINYTHGTNILINNENSNDKYLCFRSSDLAGNLSYTGVGPFKIDISSPTSDINDTGSNRKNTNINFSLTCNDGLGIGCQTTYYKILTGDISCSAGNYSSYNTSVNINIDTGSTAIKTVCYYSVDLLGNTEGYNKQLYKIDKQGPSINLLSPGSGSTSTSGTSVNFAWSGTDLGIGISGYIFRIYSGADLITGINLIGTNIVLQGLVNGNYLWNVESIDILGNTGISNTQSFVNINQYVVLPDTSNIDDFISEFTGKGYIQTTGTDIFDGLNTGTLAGNTEIYFGIDNEIQNDVVMQTTGSNNKIGILINSGTLIIQTGTNANTCDDLIYSPVFVDNSLSRDLMDDQNVFETFRVGSMCENVSLNFVNASGSSVNVKIKVESDNLDNDEYKVRYSNNGVDRNYLGDYDYNNGLEIDIDHMTYFAISQDKQVANSGGGSRRLEKDDCEYSSRSKNNLPGANEEGVDYSDSYYDRDCRGNEHGISLEGDISGSQFSDELNYAYLYAYQIGATTMPHINQANMMGNLIRKHLAKMISNYAMNEMGMIPDENRNCDFDDIDNESAEMGYYINLACQLGLMGLKSDGSPDTKFNPNSTVTRSQFGTSLSRLLYGEEFNVSGNELWYKKHLNNLKFKQIMTKIENPNIKEKRGYVMLMLMRSKTLK